MAIAAHFRRLQFTRPLIYQDAYIWLVLFAALEAALTWALLQRGALSIGSFNEMVLRSAGPGAVAVYQFILAVLLVVLCEDIGRRRLVTGRMVANLVAGFWGLAVVIMLLQFYMTL